MSSASALASGQPAPTAGAARVATAPASNTSSVMQVMAPEQSTAGTVEQRGGSSHRGSRKVPVPDSSAGEEETTVEVGKEQRTGPSRGETSHLGARGGRRR